MVLAGHRTEPEAGLPYPFQEVYREELTPRDGRGILPDCDSVLLLRAHQCWRRPVPNTPARKKQMRQDESRRARNRWRKRSIKDHTKTFLTAIQDRDIPAAEAAYITVQKELDKVSTTSTIHKNNAARRKSRLSRRLRDLKQSTTS